MSRSGPRLRRVVAGLMAALASGLATLFLVEFSLRLFWPQSLLHDPDAFIDDPVLTGRLKPGFRDRFTGPEYATVWEINQKGYRGPAAGPKGPGALRIAALGDSFTFGYGVEEREAWPRRLEAVLGGTEARRVEVFNLGIGGYGTTQEVEWLAENLAGGLAPDLVVVGFYPGNDLSDSLRGEAALAARGRRGGGGGPAPGAASLPQPPRGLRIKRWLGSRLHLYTLVSERADGLLVRLGLRNVVYPEEVEVLRTAPSAEVLRGWEAVGRALRRLGDLARDRGFHAAVMAIPMRHQVVPAAWDRVRAYYSGTTGSPLRDVDPEVPSARLAAACELAGVDLLDLLPPFRGERDPARLYFARDQHWTRAGHEAGARALSEWLQRGVVLRGTGTGGWLDPTDNGS